MSNLDPRDPLVFDIRELGRRAGSMMEVDRTVPAPADLGGGVAVVQPGTDLVLDLRFKGSSEELAEQVDGRKFGENKLEVVDFAPDRVDCNFR